MAVPLRSVRLTLKQAWIGGKLCSLALGEGADIVPWGLGELKYRIGVFFNT